MGTGEGKGRAADLCWGACAFCTLALGVLLLLLGVWSTHLRHRFTPVYRDIECKLGTPKLGKVSLLGRIEINLITTTTCQNPNQYTVEMRSTRPGPVYMGRDRMEVASVTDIPKTTLPSRGTGSIEAHISIQPTAEMLGVLFQFLLGDVPIYFDNSLELVIDIRFLLGKFSTTKSFNKKCGLRVQGLLNAKAGQVGPMACADSFDQLRLPEVRDQAAVDELRLSGFELAPEEIKEGTHIRDVGLGTSMGLGYGLGILLICLASWGLWRLFAHGCKRGHVAEEASNSTREVSGPKIGAQGSPQEV